MKKLNAVGIITAAVCLMGLAPVVAQERAGRSAEKEEKAIKKQVETPEHGVAVLIPTKGSDVRGVLLLEQKDDALHIRGKVAGLSPGLHGFHIHEYGDIRDPQGQAAGGHFNPRGHKHGGPGDKEHHAGDLGNIEANEEGVATVDVKAPWLKLHYVVGRSIVVHQEKDDLESQPSGDAGDRLAVGVIGIAQPPQEETARTAEKPKR